VPEIRVFAALREVQLMPEALAGASVRSSAVGLRQSYPPRHSPNLRPSFRESINCHRLMT